MIYREHLRHGKRKGVSPFCAALVSTIWACILVGAIMVYEWFSVWGGF